MKEFLSQKNVAYVEKNVREDQEALKEVLALGFQSTPVTLIDGEAIVGFDPEKIAKLLNL